MLKEKLLEELPGLLKLSLEAYAAARVYGFTEPASSTTAKQEWRKEIDQVAQFVDECCQSDPAAEVSFSDLFRAYSRWAADEQVRLHMAKKGFRERLSRLGYGERRDRHTRFVTGLKIVQTLADPHDFG